MEILSGATPYLATTDFGSMALMLASSGHNWSVERGQCLDSVEIQFVFYRTERRFSVSSIRIPVTCTAVRFSSREAGSLGLTSSVGRGSLWGTSPAPAHERSP